MQESTIWRRSGSWEPQISLWQTAAMIKLEVAHYHHVRREDFLKLN